jgi:tetratricopeptide (TPR) repeat protein
MFKRYRAFFFVLIPVLLVSGCAAGKIVAPPSPEPGAAKVDRPVFPASGAKPFPKEAQAEATQPPDNEPFSDIESERTPAVVTACQEDQPLVQVERYLRLPTVSHVDRRMSLYGEKLARWETLAEQTMNLGLVERRPANWSECFTAMENLFQNYSRLLEEVLKQDLPTVREEELGVDPWQLYYDDIAYLEGDCEQVFVTTAALVTGWDNRYKPASVQESEAAIGQYVDQGHYEQAIRTFQNLRNDNPNQNFKEETRKMYGLALLKTGQLDKAGRELSKVLEGMPSSPEKRRLRRLVADLLLASGHLEEAYANYRQLAEYYDSGRGDDRWVTEQLALLEQRDLKNSPGLPLYLNVLQDFIGFNGRKIPEDMKAKVARLEEVYPASPLTGRARQMFGQIEDSLREWLKAEMAQVDLYLAARDFAPAKELLKGLLDANLEPPARELVESNLVNVTRLENEYILGLRSLEDQNQAEKWDRAVALLDSRKYDQAINEFSDLFNTDYDVPAREKIKEAMEAAATQMRRQAANLFVKARKTANYDEKKKYLEESWTLLNKIITHYPEARIIDKTRQNLALIEQQIEQFDSSLLRKLKNFNTVSALEPGSANVIPSEDFR